MLSTFLAESMQTLAHECCCAMGRMERTCRQPFILLGFDVQALKTSMSKGMFLSLADLVPRGGILSQLSWVTFFFFMKGHLLLNRWIGC